MALGKQIIVLSGGGHKGVVKLLHGGGMVKGSCNLDFRPQGASLFFIGDNVAKTDIKDINSTFEVPFSSTSDINCVLRSSSVTMFGGVGNKSDLLKKVETFVKNSLGSSKTEQLARAKTSGAENGGKSAQSCASEDNADDAVGVIDESGRGQETSNSTDGKSDIKKSETTFGDATDVGTFSVRFANELIRYDGNNFYYAVKPQIDEMFVCYPLDEALCRTVENSKWVRVDAEDGYYVVGLLFDEEEPTFICYGVPSAKKDRPPEELEDMCVWLPLNENTQDAAGYWVIYQSAKTGEIVK